MIRSRRPRRMYVGSHLPILMKVVQLTSGPILELGCGEFSSNYLYWACFPTKRKLVSYENNPDFYYFADKSKSDFHEVHCITDWDSIDLSEQWSVAFVDHQPALRRKEDIKRLTHAEYVVVHDTENVSNHKYHYVSIYNLFKYRWKYRDTWPNTTVFSNFHDVTNFTVK